MTVYWFTGDTEGSGMWDFQAKTEPVLGKLEQDGHPTRLTLRHMATQAM